jgi:anti-sigma B factor antagonist
MPEPALHAEVVRDHDDVVILTVSGEIDLATAPSLAAALDDIEVGSGRRVHLDLADVTFLDSSGISVLVECRQRLEDGGAVLVLHRATPTVRRVLEISGLEAVFELRPDAPV